MKFTEFFRLGAVEAGEPLNALEDSRRFLTIDRQLLGLFEVFGNGIINGWSLSSGNGLSVVVSPGTAHVDFMSAETVIPRTVPDLLPNDTNWIYAQSIEETRFNRDVHFFASPSQINNRRVVLLGRAITGESTVLEINTDIRDDISFIDLIKTLINAHRHRGGADNPSKIDLQSEVFGQLPSFRVDGIDAAKIISGRIDAGRIPLIEHSSLLNSGVLTHSQLDSYVRNLSNPNVKLLGELGAINLLQMYLAYKHVWSDFDAYTTNLLALIPGISPDWMTDFAKTTAIVDKTNHAIQGLPALQGQLLYLTWTSDTDFNNAFSRKNVINGTNTSGDYIKLGQPIEEIIIDGFDNASSSGISVSGWTVETIAITTGDDMTFQTDQDKKVDGAYSAKLKLKTEFRVQLTKKFTQAQNWSNYNELRLWIETLSEDHGQFLLQILDKNYNNLGNPFAIPLAADEVTSGFREITIDLLSITDRSEIGGIRLYTETSLGWDITKPVEVNIDSIRIRNTLFYYANGYIRFRFQTPQKSKWAALSWEGTDNGGTIQARARSAPNFAYLDQTTSAPFGPYISSGDDPQIDDNLCIEVEVALDADPTNTSTPIVESITLSFITNAETDGLTVDTMEQFLRGTAFKNVTVTAPTGSNGQVVIDGRIESGDLVYSTNTSVQQVAPSTNQISGWVPILGFTGASLPPSPYQAYDNRVAGFDGVAHVDRLDDRTYLMTDTLNDRVMLLDKSGNILNCLASNNIHKEDRSEMLMAVYNRDLSTIYITLSYNAPLANIDISKLYVSAPGLSLSISTQLDQLVTLTGTSKISQEASNVVAIKLGALHATTLNNYLDTSYTDNRRMNILAEPDALPELTNGDNAVLYPSKIRFVTGIYKPISVSINSEEKWMICNAKPVLTTSDGSDPSTGVSKSEITSVIEMNPDTGEVTYSDNSIDFSIITLGGAVEYDENYIAVAGILSASQAETTAATAAENVSESTNVLAGTEAATASSDIVELSKYRGHVKVIQRSSGRVVYDQLTSDGTWASDIQVDPDLYLTVVERFFDGQNFRGRIIKLDEDGNVFFQYGVNGIEGFNDVRLLPSGNMVTSS